MPPQAPLPIRALALGVLALSLAGCTAEEAVLGEVRWTAEDPRVSDGWAYDGLGVRLAEGNLTLAVSDRANTGEIAFTVREGFNTWRLDWTEFAGSRPFHDGGIARDLVEHGASGTGDASIPEVNLSTTGWGNARLYLNGKLVHDPATGAEAMPAHFMVVEGTLRDETGVIWNAGRTAPYAPAAPADGHVAPEGRQIFVQVRSAEPESFSMVFEFQRVREG